MTDYVRVLRNEFEAGENSFLIQLRPNMIWDRDAFSRLVSAMEDCCRESADLPTMERWMAQGFWYVPNFIRVWTTHPEFPRPHPADYYERAYRRLDDLAHWFFFGHSGDGWCPVGPAQVD